MKWHKNILDFMQKYCYFCIFCNCFWRLRCKDWLTDWRTAIWLQGGFKIKIEKNWFPLKCSEEKYVQNDVTSCYNCYSCYRLLHLSCSLMRLYPVVLFTTNYRRHNCTFALCEHFNRNEILLILIFKDLGSQITSNIKKNNRKW